MNPRAFRFRLLAGCVFATCAALSAPSGAAVLGQLRSIAADKDGQSWDLRTDTGAHVRVTLARPDIVRIWAGPGETLAGPGDKAAPIVVGVPAAGVAHTVEDTPAYVVIRTAALALRIDRKPLRFSLYRAGEDAPLWRELQPLDIDAKQAVQVLSSDANEHFFGGGQQNGRYEFKGRELPVSYSGGWDEGDRPNPAPFLLSSKGWGMLRNTWSDGSYDLRNPDQSVLQHAEGRFDAYYFVAKDLRSALGLYTDWTGRARLLPRWALEYGDADCYNDGDNVKKPGTVPKGWSDGPTGKTPDVVDSVAKRYREFDMPGGWILPNDGYGCGYTQLPETVRGLAGYGFRTGLWTENGVDKIAWEVGQAGTRVQKLDVAWTGKGYQFSLDANKAAYDGILNNSDSRPFIWTVMGWAGTQRYAVAWTGDQSASWDYIRWHVPTLIGSGLSGQAYASGDVDAIFGGSPETYTRDLQWKSFTPVLMGMSGWSAAERKHPWWFDEPYRDINRRYLKLKLRLTPYMYTLAREAEDSGAPLVRGMMWDYPQDPAALTERYKYQFLLGRDLLVAPVYRSQAASGGWRKGIHLPQGVWYDYWDGRQASAGAAGRDLDVQVTLDKLPVFVRAGAILPMYPEALYDGQKPKDRVTFDVYPALDAASEFVLYEDDGNTRRYRDGASSRQTIRMRSEGADLFVDAGAVDGSYAGQEARRGYGLRIPAAHAPGAVLADGRALPALQSMAALDAGGEGWYRDAAERGGTLYVKTALQDIRRPLALAVRGVLAARADDAFPAAPDTGRAIPADAITVVSRPAEEPGQNLERAFDGKPETWFRTVRSQAVHSGPHEWVLGFGERRLLDGIELAPRNDKNWKSGQVRDYEVYVGDSNGDWGAPVARGRLALAEGMQTIAFPPTVGRLLRFRVMSVHNPDGGAAGAPDPMVIAANARVPARAYDAALPADVPPIALSEFHVLEHRVPERPEIQRYLSELALPKSVARDKPNGAAQDMRMNGLRFRKGLGVGPASRIDLALAGDWNLLRADLGIDDSCRGSGGLQFQVWSGARLLYDSGLIAPPAVVKPELDIRGLHELSLRTIGASGPSPGKVCANWANAQLTGNEGATVTPR